MPEAATAVVSLLAPPALLPTSPFQPPTFCRSTSAGMGAGIWFDSEVTLEPQNLASTQLVDTKTPNSEVRCALPGCCLAAASAAASAVAASAVPGAIGAPGASCLLAANLLTPN